MHVTQKLSRTAHVFHTMLIRWMSYLFFSYTDSKLSCCSYLQMLNLSNEAIRRMYLACKDNGCFPGDLPTDEHDRNVSIHAILGGLGLLTDGMLPSDTPISPSDDSGSRRQSQSTTSGRYPRASSGSSDPSIDNIDTSSFENTNAFPSSMSAHSSTSHHSFDDSLVPPTTQMHSFDSSQQRRATGPPSWRNLDFLSFGSQNTTIPLVSLASATSNDIQPLGNDFLFPWPGTFAAAIDPAEYHQQQ
jgi:hypothetical protein